MVTYPVADAHVKVGIVNHIMVLLTSGTSATRYGGAGGMEAWAASGEFPKKAIILLATYAGRGGTAHSEVGHGERDHYWRSLPPRSMLKARSAAPSALSALCAQHTP
ncbi:hypothetical protein DFH08DRAFT_824243 [Mycena albidolilacea]|uniref:Uncharacterized protein n=1 Tax=Mycena albidolilacea TaxID=1033008 RepID=A0AAD7EAK2_9AGAR|nr:hypothetical protein DFH08DRAFT_824243 [Mycena albidolilacea]